MEASAKPQPGRPYYWWHGADLKEFVAKLLAKGLDNVRVEFHPDSELLFVKDEGVSPQFHEPGGGTNEAHKCPPDC